MSRKEFLLVAEILAMSGRFIRGGHGPITENYNEDNPTDHMQSKQKLPLNAVEEELLDSLSGRSKKDFIKKMKIKYKQQSNNEDY